MEDFLPKDYEVPVTVGNYMKFQDGENTFRVLSSAITGWEYWNKDNKPVRKAQGWSEVPDDIKTDENGEPSQIRHFWACVVWNYATNTVQILEITQKTVQTAIKALVRNKKWGDPKGFDITVTRSGEKLTTEYAVMPNPHAPITDEQADAFLKKPIKLEALFAGADPFAN